MSKTEIEKSDKIFYTEENINDQILKYTGDTNANILYSLLNYIFISYKNDNATILSKLKVFLVESSHYNEFIDENKEVREEFDIVFRILVTLLFVYKVPDDNFKFNSKNVYYHVFDKILNNNEAPAYFKVTFTKFLVRNCRNKCFFNQLVFYKRIKCRKEVPKFINIYLKAYKKQAKNKIE